MKPTYNNTKTLSVNYSIIRSISALFKMLKLLEYMYSLIYNHVLALDSAHWSFSCVVTVAMYMVSQPGTSSAVAAPPSPPPL
jgi:hypothetical protein